jgi:hypothetical protein
LRLARIGIGIGPLDDPIESVEEELGAAVQLIERRIAIAEIVVFEFEFGRLRLYPPKVVDDLLEQALVGIGRPVFGTSSRDPTGR